MRKFSIFHFPFATKNGFTLIELLVVIAILGMLVVATFAIINPFEQVKKSDDAKRKSDFVQIKNALELYYQDHGGQYPKSSTNYQIINTVGINNTTLLWGSPWPPYMNMLPRDPLPTNSYVYYSPNGQTYYLYASLERGRSDSQSCNKGNACASLSQNGIPANACGGICNYGISSPNVTP